MKDKLKKKIEEIERIKDVLDELEPLKEQMKNDEMDPKDFIEIMKKRIGDING